MKSTTKAAKQDLPYLYDHYNVKCYYGNQSEVKKDIPSHIMNSFITALEENIYLPCLVLIVLDTELIQHIDHYNTGFRVLACGLIDWIANNITRAIEFRKTDLIHIRPGAVTIGEPRVIWT